MAVLSAGAGLRLFRVHLDMAQLTGSAEGTVEDPSVQDHRTADRGPDGDHHSAFVPLPSALPIFTKSRSLCVVFHTDVLDPGQLTHFIPDIFILPAQIDGQGNKAPVQDRSGYVDPDAADFRPPDVSQLQNAFHGIFHIGKDKGSVVSQPGRDLPVFNQFTIFVKQAQLYRCSSDINTEQIFFHNTLHASRSCLFSIIYHFIILCAPGHTPTGDYNKQHSVIFTDNSARIHQ